MRSYIVSTTRPCDILRFHILKPTKISKEKLKRRQLDFWKRLNKKK